MVKKSLNKNVYIKCFVFLQNIGNNKIPANVTREGSFESIPILFVLLIPETVLIVQQTRTKLYSFCGSWYCNTNVIKIILEEL